MRLPPSERRQHSGVGDRLGHKLVEALASGHRLGSGLAIDIRWNPDEELSAAGFPSGWFRKGTTIPQEHLDPRLNDGRQLPDDRGLGFPVAAMPDDRGRTADEGVVLRAPFHDLEVGSGGFADLLAREF